MAEEKTLEMLAASDAAISLSMCPFVGLKKNRLRLMNCGEEEEI
jgi:hypothetical protein